MNSTPPPINATANSASGFLANLKPAQLVVFWVMLLGLLGVLGKMLYESIRDKPQDWDESNGLVLEEKIQLLNRRLKDSKTELDVLAGYQGEVRASYQAVQGLTFQGDTVSALLGVQPYYIIKYYRAYEVVRELGKSVVHEDMESTPFTNDIQSKGIAYAQLYLSLAHLLGREVYPGYGPATPDNLLNSQLSSFSFQKRVFDVPRDSLGQPMAGMSVPDGTSADSMLIGRTKQELLRVVADIDSTTGSRIRTLEKQGLELEKDILEKQQKYKEGNLNINKYAVVIGIPLFIAAVLVMFYLGLRNSNLMREQIMTKGLDPDLYRYGLTYSLSGITVLLLILSLLILGLASVLKQDGLSALFGAIAGYVLNNAANKAREGVAPPTPGSTGGPPPNAGAQGAANPGGGPPPSGGGQTLATS